MSTDILDGNKCAKAIERVLAAMEAPLAVYDRTVRISVPYGE